MNINQIAADCRYMMFWKTPYRTGNLALNGITDVGVYGANRAGFGLYPGVGTQYGKILNEVPVIRYNITNSRTGKTYTGEYTNKHYRYVDKFADDFANQIVSLYPGIRRS